ncbi:vWA domain-containing protein [Jiella avicenniae]|uniref:VWA domain-containing protein n=1 Tax=Jiella avicenniae TaxID=2907202 RepID=A0A9X1TD45_9HYPH|nr:VWA domain-containing protein [Jiella avicenniae]MCE7029668.1 VWA domain-containing protein [Jiella avicenniae]
MSAAAERHIDGFLSALANAGLEPSPLRRTDFLRALTRTDLPSVTDLYWTARITLVFRHEQIEPFDDVFDAWFRNGDELVRQEVEAPESEENERPPDSDSGETPPPAEMGEGTGEAASLDEFLANRGLAETGEAKRDICREITDLARGQLPRERSRRAKRASRPGTLDLRRVLSEMRRSGGEIVHLAYRERPTRMRRVLMLIDVSGSLKATSPDALRYAHALMKAAPRMEVFTFGTRLTRITRTLRTEDVDEALEALSDVIFDFDGGTRIGPTFESFLSDGRLQTLARGALVIIVSDGLERGDVTAMRDATGRLSRLAHRLVWLTPLMSDSSYKPATRGMQAILGTLDRLGDAGTLSALCEEVAILDAKVERAARGQVAARWA